MSLSRRRFLAYVGASLAPIRGCGPPPPADWQALAVRAAACFDPADLASVRRIGDAALSGLERDEASLEAELMPTLLWLEGDPLDCDATIAADFAARETRLVEGWTLAATEVHLAILIALYGVEAAPPGA